ncbi:MAG: polyprenyl synthetase family protein [Actinomycetota bacterium]|nr:polyprenyl synthetase family protein [Actinomycetota bacterium]MDA8278829.1 polyprenyl synthetase family protein [Actinomycetota bacterium]
MNVAPLIALPAMEDNLKRLEPVLRESVCCGDAFLDEVVCHLIDAGGKRVRPGLALAAATAGGREASDDDLLGGVSVELVHLASLYHDDVMDEATMRRNVPSVNARWGNLVAIVAGDFLLARSAEIAASLGSEIAGLLAHTLGELCRGQVAEVQAAYRLERTEADYLATIAGKTAALMATSCRIGALTAGLPRSEVEALTTFGHRFGMVFQIRDDVLDVVGTEVELGKPAGQDLAEGIYTLPVLVALADPVHGAALRPLLGRPLQTFEREEARVLVAGAPGIVAAVDLGRRFADEAADAVASLADHNLASALADLSHSMVDAIDELVGQARADGRSGRQTSASTDGIASV